MNRTLTTCVRMKVPGKSAKASYLNIIDGNNSNAS